MARITAAKSTLAKVPYSVNGDKSGKILEAQLRSHKISADARDKAAQPELDSGEDFVLRLGRRGNYRIPAMPFGIPAPVDPTLFINGKHDSVIDSIAVGAAQVYLDLMITEEDAVVARFDALPSRHPARRRQAQDVMRRKDRLERLRAAKMPPRCKIMLAV